MALWPQWRSPLVWDVFAVSTYATVSLLFWYVGLIPDLATLRDRARKPVRANLYGILAMGWRGSAKHWHRYRTAYLLLAGLATPAGRLGAHGGEPRLHRGDRAGLALDDLPPYFVAGAIFSGFAMVLTLCDPPARGLRPAGLHHACGTWRTWPRSCWPPG